MTLTITWTGELEELSKLQDTLAIVIHALKKRKPKANVEERSGDTSDVPGVRIDTPIVVQVEKKPEKVPIPGWQKTEIVKLKASGLGVGEIAKQLGIPDARRVQGIILQAERRQKAKSITPEQAEVRQDLGSQHQQNVKPGPLGAQEDPTLLDDEAEDELILKMAQDGAMPMEIKVAVERNFGQVISTAEAKRRADGLLEEQGDEA